MRALKGSIVSLIFFMMGCSEVIPITISESQQLYVGLWHYTHEVEKNNRLDVKDVVLNIKEDGSAIYKTCSVVVEKESMMENSSSNSVYLNSAIVTKLNDAEMSITQETALINLNYDLLITKKPFQKNNHWYVEIDNVLLSKQKTSLLPQLIEHYCPDIEDIELGTETDKEEI